MTDPRTPPPDDREPVDPDVALASAHVDGELDEAEWARIEADPGAAALAVRLAAIAHEVCDLPPPPAELVDAQVSAALAAMDDEELPAGDAHRAAVPLDPARRASPARPWWQRAPLGAVAAVIGVVALVGAIGLASQAGDDDEDTAATALDAGDAGDGAEGGDARADAEDDTEAFEAAPFDRGGDGVGGASVPRPAFGDYDELAAALQAAPATTSAAAAEADRSTQDDGGSEDEVTADEDAAPIDPCGAIVVLGLEGMEIEQVLPATVDGAPVTAVVYVADGERRVWVVDDMRCTPTFEGALTG